MDSSSGSVICESITSALAPRYVVETLITGVSRFGYSRTPRKKNPITPKMMMTMDITVARTGRWMLVAYRLMEVMICVMRDE